MPLHTPLSPAPSTTRVSPTPRPLPLVVALALAVALALVAPGTAAEAATPSASRSSSAGGAAIERPVDARMTQVFRNRVIEISRSKRGAPYRYGAAGPRAFDCSGFTMWVYRKAGRRIPRTSSSQARAAHRIRARDRRRGDLVFFTSGRRVYHVGIYAGRGAIWHSPRPGQRVRRERIWTRAHFYGRIG